MASIDRAMMVRALAGLYYRHKRRLHEFWDEYREEYDEEGLVVVEVIRLEPMIKNRYEELLAMWRHKNGRAHVPDEVRIRVWHRLRKYDKSATRPCC